MPDKKHLLEYDDPFYCEDTPEKAALRRFMEERVGLSGDKLEDAFDDLLYGVRSVSGSVEGVLSHFDKRNIRFRSDRDMNRFVELYSKFSNTTRMPCNLATHRMR